jgi:hypothetical protein
MTFELGRSVSASPHGKASVEPLVIIVDDDQAVREGLAELIMSSGYEPLCFG